MSDGQIAGQHEWPSILCARAIAVILIGNLWCTLWCVLPWRKVSCSLGI